MERVVGARLEARLSGSTRLTFAIAVAQGQDEVRESLRFVLDGEPQEALQLVDRHGSRLHTLTAGPGTLVVDYEATVTGRAAAPEIDELDLLTYQRPSRYCESDTLLPTARAEFAGLEGKPLLDAVSSWVGRRLSYVSGSTGPTDGAVDSLLTGQGVCRDYAHLVVALLRALDVPARVAAVYAPGLSPMDFHAVAEAYVEGGWHVVDATLLAPRASLLRIATGRDAADTAFLTSHGPDLELVSMQVSAVVDELPEEDVTRLVELR